ncbi:MULTISPECIES: hypothetical protein [Streptomyces]|uniref:Uncharacterized protein n=1 Tax=Streptomyces fimbriatus TaxID=68197 RepID=A0ABW0DKP4_STRFI
MIENWSGYYRSPDGRHYSMHSRPLDPPACVLQPAVQDPDTGQWHTDRDAPLVEVSEEEFAAYVEVPRERLRDPRITRLAGLVTDLLAEYEVATGRPAATAAEIREALDQVAEIPEEARQRRHAAARNAAAQGFHRGRRR